MAEKLSIAKTYFGEVEPSRGDDRSAHLNSICAQQPASLTFSAAQNCIKIGPGGVVPHGSATIISTTAPGTRIARIRLTNTVAFGQFAPNFSFNFTASPYNTAVFALDQTSPLLEISSIATPPGYPRPSIFATLSKASPAASSRVWPISSQAVWDVT